MLDIKEYRLFLCDASHGFIESHEASANEIEVNYLTKKIKKIHGSDELKKSILAKSTITNSSLYNYLLEESDFDECANELIETFYDYKTEIGAYDPFDVFVVDYVLDDIHYFGIIECNLKKGYTHYVLPDEDSFVNEVIEYNAILSESIGKEDNIFIYDLLNENVLVKEVAYATAGEVKHFFSDLMFPCKVSASEKEVTAILNSSVKEVASRYDISFNEVVPSLKIAMNHEKFDIEEIAEEVFENKDAKMEFLAKVKDKGIEKNMDFDVSRLKKKDRVIKYITESGIEISIPNEYLRRKDKVEIINNPDGTISIEIKNVNELKNR